MLLHIAPCITKNIISSLDGAYHIKLCKEYACELEGDINKFWIQSHNGMTKMYFDYTHRYRLNNNALHTKHILNKNLLNSKLVATNFDIFYTNILKELKQIISYNDIEWNNNKIVFKSAKITTFKYKNDDINRNLCDKSDTRDREVKLNKVIIIPKDEIFGILKSNSLTFEIPLEQLSTYCEWENVKKETKPEIKNEEKKPEKQEPRTKHLKTKIIVGVVVPLICLILLVLLIYSYGKTKCTKIDSTVMYVTI